MSHDVAVEALLREASTPGAHAEGSHASPWSRLVDLLRAESTDLWVLLVYGAGVGLVSLAVPVAVSALVNTVTFGTMLQPLVILSALVLVGLVFEGVLSAMQFRVVELVQRRVFVRTAVDLAHRLPWVRASAFDQDYGPSLVNRFFDVLTVQKTAATLLLDGMAIALQTLVGTALLAFYHPLLLAFDALLVASLAVVLFPLGRGAVQTSIAESKAKYATAAWLEELSRHDTVFRSEAARRFAASRGEHFVVEYLRARGAHFRIVIRQHIGSYALKAVLSALLLGLGGYLVIERQLTVGQLAAAEIIVSGVLVGVGRIGKQLDNAYDLVTALDKLGHLTDLPLEREGGDPAPPRDPRGSALRCESVSFGYSPRSPVLHDLDLSVAPGEAVALMSPTHGGKSTLAQLLIGLRTPSRGVIRLDGADLRELSLGALRREVALVGDPEVFEGTVAENIALGRDDVSPEAIRQAVARVGLEATVGELHDGLHSVLQSGGAPLSSAQISRLMIARALVGGPRLLLLDGVLDGLDEATLRDVLPALLAAHSGRTLLVLTRREDIAARLPRTIQLTHGVLRSGATQEAMSR